MSELKFTYGTMGSSKTAQALMKKFNYEQKGKNVWLIKPSIDTRDGKGTLSSRIGISSPCIMVSPKENLYMLFNHRYDVIIVDEAQFLTSKQVEELKMLAEDGYPVFCYGLKTDFQTNLFEGSKRLVEIADTMNEIETTCDCGNKASVNGRFINKSIVNTGDVIKIAGDETYKPMCYKCWREACEENK